MISGDFEVPKTGWYERGDNAYEYRGDDNAKIWDSLTEDERKCILKDYFRDIGTYEIFDRMYDEDWKFRDFVDYFVDMLHERGFREMIEDRYELIYLEQGECFAHPMEVGE